MDNIMLNVYRGDILENSHRWHIAVVDIQGNLLYSFGNPYRVTHGRLALKPFQVIPLIETGAADEYQLTEAELALCASSHSGEVPHRSHVHSILERIGVPVDTLVCGVTVPIDLQSYEDMIREGESITAVCHECSSVHAGMLATAVYMGEDVQDYTNPNHPIQQPVKQAVMDVTNTTDTEIQIATDGCGIPTYCMPLDHIAWGFARLAAPDKVGKGHEESLRRIVNAYFKFPEMVTGKKTYSTRVFHAFGNRILLKEGSQGVFGMTDFQEGIGVAIKIEDGRKTELPQVLNAVFEQLDIGVHGPLQALYRDADPQLEDTRNQGVGQFKAEFTLMKHME
jgi:L-asparaginase II